MIAETTQTLPICGRAIKDDRPAEFRARLALALSVMDELEQAGWETVGLNLDSEDSPKIAILADGGLDGDEGQTGRMKLSTGEIMEYRQMTYRECDIGWAFIVTEGPKCEPK